MADRFYSAAISGEEGRSDFVVPANFSRISPCRMESKSVRDTATCRLNRTVESPLHLLRLHAKHEEVVSFSGDVLGTRINCLRYIVSPLLPGTARRDP